jgi:putative transposase
MKGLRRIIIGSVARVIGSEERLVFRHNYPFKAFHSAQATIAGIETAHMIREQQSPADHMPAYKQFIALAG